MNKSANPPRLREARQHLVFRVTPIAAACSGLMLAAAPALAQEAAKASDAAQTVVVTGIRHAIETSVAVKRNSDSIVEAVSAEDIGKLPDVSIAESLARLPGLAGQRVAGRAQVIAIRGLSPDFAGTLLNGREQVTTGDNRGVEYDQFPSELINAALVYKTPHASLIGQGLSGTIDLQSIRPLDFASRRVTLNARAELNSNGTVNADTDATGGRFSASYVDQFADRTIGVALGFAHLDSPGQELHYKAWGFSTGEANSFCAQHPDWGCSPVTGVPVGTSYLNGFEVTATSRKQTRDGLMAVLEFKPNKDVHSVVDLYYSKFKKSESMRGLMGGLGDNWGGVPGAAFSNIGTTAISDSTTLITSGTVANANMIVRNDLNTRDDELKSIGWNLEARLDQKLKGIADFSYSRTDRSENVIETYAGAPTLATFDFNIPGAAGFPSLVPNVDYADPATIMLRDPGGWGHDGLWKKPKASDELHALRLEGRRDMEGIFSRFDFGLNHSNREKNREMNELALNLKNGRAPVLVSENLLQSPTPLGFAGIPGVLAYDVMGMINQNMDLSAQAEDQIVNRKYQITERVTTAYAKLNIDSEVFSLPLRGNLGLQFVNTVQSSDGFSKLRDPLTNVTTISQTTRGTSYADVLPSLNLVLELPANQNVRFGLAKTMARGRMDDMRAGAEASINQNTRLWSGSGGNPELEPWRATSVDLAYEKYFGKRSYVAAAYFYKNLQNYIYTQEVEMDFSGIPNTTGITPISNIGLFRRPENGQGGMVRGVELSGSLDAGLLHNSLEGFGVVGSVSYTDSSVHPDGPGTSAKLPGLSGMVSNLSAYYEQSGFSARVSQRYRSAFRGEINGLHNARQFTDILADKQIDAQLGYEFESGSLKGLSILLQVNNLTNSPYATKQGNGFGDVVAPQEYNTYGRQYLVGVNYKL
jgi:iron complex outermembrane receptor protein